MKGLTRQLDHETVVRWDQSTIIFRKVPYIAANSHSARLSKSNQTAKANHGEAFICIQ